jgi:predicted nucleotidyltransferase component of viral defense system
MLIDDLRLVVERNKEFSGTLYMRNLLKEVLQLYTLNFIYTSVFTDSFLFKGGTCLRVCFELPRLSEDLDFDIKNYSRFSMEKFSREIENYFVRQLQYRDFSWKIAGNGKQLFLKFPVLDKIGLPFSPAESKVLFLRIDINPVETKNYSEEISLKTTYNFSFAIKRYSLSDLFSSKLAAVIGRSFKKGKGNKITFKGRDYFDLIWFLEKGVQPNFERLKEITKIKSKEEILHQVDKKVSLVKESYLKEDLLPLFRERTFVETFVANFKKLYKQYRFSFSS